MATVLLATGVLASACSSAATESNATAADSSNGDSASAVFDAPESAATADGVALSFAQADEPVAGFPIDLDFAGLEPLGPDFVYEGWVVVDGTPVSTGRFTIAEIDGTRTYVGDSLATQSDLDNATDFVLTIEPAVGDDPAPADAKPLGGVITDCVAELTHAHPAALGDDFSSAGGTFVIATPTTASDPTDDYSGVWFIETPGNAEAVQFTFENLQPADGFFFTEAWVGLHNGDFDLFEAGQRATPGLEALAEGGNTELLGSEFAAPGPLQTTIGNANVQCISPGATIEGSIDVINPAAYRYVSFASMIIPSNDAFFGNDDATAYEVFDAAGNFNGPITIDIFAEDLYDAGTEVNDGFGAAGFSQTGPAGVANQDSTDDTASTVGAHPGFTNLLGIETAAGTTIASDIDPGEPVAQITIDLGTQLTTQSAVGPIFNGSVIAGGPVAGLDLPTLPAGWVYEGWAVIDGVPVSTGRFIDPTMPDDFSGFSGTDPNPPFPGEDFIINAPDGLTFPTDLTDGGTIVLSIEPEDDDSPAPFAFKPLALSVDGLDFGVANLHTLEAGPGFPSGTATVCTPDAAGAAAVPATEPVVPVLGITG